jgi:mRNA interferase RelE/StbE
MLQVRTSKSADKALRRMPRDTAGRIAARIDRLAADPFAPDKGVRRLRGRDAYRLRVGKWLRIYEIHGKTLTVVAVAPRGGAYR